MQEIVFLPKEQYKGTPVPLDYENDSYYDLEIGPMDEKGCAISLVRKPREAFTADHHDSLYQEYWEAPEAWGVVDGQGKVLACIEVTPEEWSNRLLVTELWVSKELRGQGVGKRLMDKAKEIAAEQKRRAVILETQSCNTNAIGFYLHEGFELIGFDTCCYTNDDIGKKEVRLNLGYFFHKEPRRW